ncbi:MAG: DUF917 domain-containing protein [Pseudomonadota bacterium]
MKLTLEDMSDLARGAAFLGCGGGGDPYLGRLLCEHAISVYGAPEVISLEDLPDDASVYALAMHGAPTVIIEKLFSVEDFEIALAQLEKFTGRPATAVISGEAGGFNGLLPIAIAAKRGLPVVDADGVGRAVPEAQMTTWNANGIEISPISMANEHGESVIINARNALAGEQIARAVTVEMGLFTAIALYSMTGEECKRASVPKVLKISLRIGRAIREGRASNRPLEALLDTLRDIPTHASCAVLFDGKISDVNRETSMKGFTFARYRLTSIKGEARTVHIDVQNENLIARCGEQILGMTPDLLVLVDAETIEPLTTETIRHGQRVKLIGASVGPMLRTPQSLQWFGPEAFGLDTDYIPIERLMLD